MKHLRRTGLAALAFAVLSAVAVSSALAATAFGGGKMKPNAKRRVASTALLQNGSFEGSLAGWGGYGASLSLVPGTVGQSAARVTVSGTKTSFSILPTQVPVLSTLGGSVYAAGGWVRSNTPGRTICLRIREWSGDSVAGSAQGCVTASDSWKQLPAVQHKALAGGRKLDVYVYQSSAVAGNSFDVDGLSLTSDAVTTTPPPPPPPPPPDPPVSGLEATTVDHAHVRLAWAPVEGAASYRVSRNGLLVGTTSQTTFTDAMLWPQTRYDFRVEAVSGSGAALSARTVSGSTALLPLGGFPRPFASTGVWNSPVGTTPLHPRSAALSAYLARNAKNPNMPLHSYAVSVAEAHPADRTYNVPCTRYVCSLQAFGAFAIPMTAKADSSGDGHLAVYDPVSDREWDMWQGRGDVSGWSASAGAAVSMTGDGIAPRHTASGNAANFPLLGGIVRPEELLQGRIDHALVFMMPGVSSLGRVCPATHNDGSSTDPDALMEGMRIQLDPAVDVDSLAIPAWQKTIARALQRYGAYLRDDSGSLAIIAENPASRGYDAWAKLGLSGSSVSLAGIPWNRFRVLAAETGC